MRTICDNTKGTEDVVVIRRHVFNGEPENRFVVKPGDTLESESTSYTYELVDSKAPDPVPPAAPEAVPVIEVLEVEPPAP